MSDSSFKSPWMLPPKVEKYFPVFPLGKWFKPCFLNIRYLTAYSLVSNSWKMYGLYIVLSGLFFRGAKEVNSHICLYIGNSVFLGAGVGCAIGIALGTVIALLGDRSSQLEETNAENQVQKLYFVDKALDYLFFEARKARIRIASQIKIAIIFTDFDILWQAVVRDIGAIDVLLVGVGFLLHSFWLFQANKRIFDH